MIGKDHLSINKQSFGLALSDANWRYTECWDVTTHVVDVENLVTDHKVRGIVFALPFKESIVNDSHGIYPFHEDLEKLKYQRTCLMEYLNIFSKNSGILTCVTDGCPNLEEACKMVEEGKEPYADDLDALHYR
jgi:hypothetical protein